MKFFIDTANINQIKEANEMGILDGVTTNPSLMVREGVKGKQSIHRHYLAICEIVKGDVSAEVLGTTYSEIIEEAKILSAIHPQIVVKIPMILEGIKAIRWCTENNIKTNCTLVFSSGQAILAAKAGATYVSPFIGRIDDSGWDGMSLIKEVREIYNVHHINTKILSASIRSLNHIIQSAAVGAHVCTCPLEQITALFHHPLTKQGLKNFLDDAAKMELN